MNILFLQQHIDANDLLTSYKSLIQAIINGEIRSPQAKKLVGFKYQGQTIYRAKIDKKHRLIYTFIEYQGERVLLILADNNHNYNQLKRQLMGQQQEVKLTELSDEDSMALNDKGQDVILNAMAAVSYQKDTLVLDEYQQQSLVQEAPLLLSGPPGAGKTVVLYNMMVQALQRYAKYHALHSDLPKAAGDIIFVSPSQKLIDALEGYPEHRAVMNAPAVVFTTWESLLTTHYPDKSTIADHEFGDWLKLNMPKEPAAVMHYEFSLIMALGFEHYQKLGLRQSAYAGQTNKQKKIFNLYKLWLAYLDDMGKLDPMVSTIVGVDTVKYSGVFCDEAQNLPPSALRFFIEHADNQQFVSCLDSEQCLISSFGLSCLKSMLYTVYGKFTLQHLLCTWRCPPQIAQAANHIMQLKYQLDGKDKKREYHELKSARTDEGYISLIDSTQCTALYPITERATTVVIAENCSPVEAEKIRKILKTAHVLSAQEAIGLDFDTVILWKPISSVTCLKKLDLNASSQGLNLNQWRALNALYVGLSRAQKSAFIYEDKYWHDKAKQFFGDININQPSHEVTPLTPAQKYQQWQDMAMTHFVEGRQALAREIMLCHLDMTVDEIDKKLQTLKPKTQATIPPNRAVETVVSSKKHAKKLDKPTNTPAVPVVTNVDKPLRRTRIDARFRSRHRKKRYLKVPDISKLITVEKLYTKQGLIDLNDALEAYPHLVKDIGTNLFDIRPSGRSRYADSSPLLWFTANPYGEELLIKILEGNPDLAKNMSVEVLCHPRSSMTGANENVSVLYCLAATENGCKILEKIFTINPELAKKISAEALCRWRPEKAGLAMHTSAFYWLTCTFVGLEVLSILLKANPDLANEISAKTLCLVLTKALPLHVDNSALYCLARSSKGCKILKKLLKTNPKLASEISAHDLCFIRSSEAKLNAGISLLYIFTASPDGCKILSKLLEINPDIIKDINAHDLCLRCSLKAEDNAYDSPLYQLIINPDGRKVFNKLFTNNPKLIDETLDILEKTDNMLGQDGIFIELKLIQEKQAALARTNPHTFFPPNSDTNTTIEPCIESAKLT
tara:strand:- start:266 stop:3478 length:3213 start_codon:yes stop_codon:yes gene_type:complete